MNAPTLEPLLLAAAILLLLSVVLSRVSDRLGMPALLIFLGIGMLAGSDGPGGIYFDDARLAQGLGVVALVFILFSGGLDTDWPKVRRVLGPGIALATVGVVVTAGLMGLFAVLVLGFSPLLGLLLGAIVSSTDAAAVFSVLRSRGTKLNERLRALLEFESGSNDPMAVLLTVGLIELTLHQASASALIWLLVKQVGLGLLLGYGLGQSAVWILNRLRLHYRGLRFVLSFALVLLTYSLTAVLGGSGFLAVYLAGLVVGNRRVWGKDELASFHDGLAWLMQVAMFLTLGLLVFPSQLPAVALEGFLAAMFLMFLARPVSVALSLWWFRLPWNELLLVGWVGLRGAVPIVLATFPLLARVEGSNELFNLVFFTVLLSVTLQGPTLGWVARQLKAQDTTPTPPPPSKPQSRP